MWDPRSNIPWKPSERQASFLEIPDTVFEALYGGAAGGGKSEILIMEPVARGFHQYPQFHGIIFRRTYPQLEASIIARAVPIYTAIGGSYNSSKHVFTFNSGAKVRFGYLDKDSDARDHDTNEYNLIEFDELTSFTEFMYLYLSSRCRTSSNLPAFMRAASNPGNIGHVWVRDRFVSPAREGGVLLKDNLTKQTRIFIPAKLDDNPYLTAADPEYANKLKILPEAERKAKLDGDWFIFTGQVFSEFRQIKVPSEPDNALHVIPQFPIPAYWPRVLAVDWGFAAPTYALWTAIAPDKRVYAYREYYKKGATIVEWSTDIARLSQGEKLSAIVIDPSANQNRGFEKTIKQQFVESSGFYETVNADNDRLGGKALVHDFLRFNPRPARFVPPSGFSQEVADYILRMKGTEGYHEYLALFKEDTPEVNLPRLQIFENLTYLINCIPSLVYSERNVEDVQDGTGDDPYDTLRYNLKKVDSWAGESENIFKNLSDLDRIQKNLERTGNMTEYVRQMKEHESKSRGPQPVFH